MKTPEHASDRQPSSSLALPLFMVLAVAWLWPLATRLNSRIAHDPGDPVLNTWILWWNGQALPFSNHWWDAPLFYPMRGGLTLSEHLAGIAIFTDVPLLAGLGPIAAYNLSLIAACAFSGFFTCLLVRRLTGSLTAGIAAGVAFAFSPYRGGQLAHLQVLNAQWMPLTLLGMHAHVEDGRRRWLVLIALAWPLQGLSNGYFLLFFPILLGLWLAWFGVAVPRGVSRRRLGAVGAALGIGSVLLLPVLWRYREVHGALGITRSADEMVRFSASPSSLVHAPPLSAFWPEAATPTQETYLFLGVTSAVLFITVLILAARRRLPVGSRATAGFYAVAAIIMYWLAFGPEADSRAWGWLSHPYTLLTHLPGFAGLRAPARFALPGTLCLAIVAGFAVAALAALRRPLRIAMTGLIFAGLLVDGWIEPLPLVTPPQRIRMAAPENVVVLELPAYDINVNLGAMYRSMAHQRPLVNGFSGHVPPHYSVLNTALIREDPTVLWWLARGRPLVVVVHRALDSDGAMRAFVERAGGQLQEESGVGPVFVIAPRPLEREAPVSLSRDGITVTEPSPGIVVADLREVGMVRAIGFAARWRHAELPARLTIETSRDGNAWTTAWEDWTGARLLDASLRNQQETIVSIPLNEAQTRFVRVQPAPKWLAQELNVSVDRR